VANPSSNPLLRGDDELRAIEPYGPYEIDPTVPYWHSNIDMAVLFTRHGFLSEARINAWLHYIGCAPCAVRHIGRIAEMRGYFCLGILNNRTQHWTFTPTPKVHGRAVVIEIIEEGKVIDLLAISKRDATIWGTVTGWSQFAGKLVMDAPLKVFIEPWRWLVWDCDGVLILDVASMVRLQKAPKLIVENIDCAYQLADGVWLNPAQYDGVGSVEDAERQAAERICIMGSPAEIEEELLAERM
jgi:hypothetical protein